MLPSKVLRLAGLLFLVHGVINLLEGVLLPPALVPRAWVFSTFVIDTLLGLAFLRGVEPHRLGSLVRAARVRVVGGLLISLGVYLSRAEPGNAVDQLLLSGAWMLLLVGTPGLARQIGALVGVGAFLVLEAMGLVFLLFLQPTLTQMARQTSVDTQFVRHALLEVKAGQTSLGFGVAVGRHDGQLLFLLSAPKDFEPPAFSSADSALAVRPEGQPGVIQEVRHIARLGFEDRPLGPVHLFSIPDPGPQVTVLRVRPREGGRSPPSLLFAHPSLPERLAPASVMDEGIHFLVLQTGETQSRAGAPLFDGQDGSLLGFIEQPFEGKHHAFPAEDILGDLHRRLQSVRLSWAPGAAETCQVEAEVLFWPLRPHLDSAGLLVAAPGTTPPIGEETESLEPIGPSVVRESASGDGAVVRATLADCSAPRFVQLWLLAEGQRWLSIPLEIPAHGREPGRRFLPLEPRSWGIDTKADPDPSRWAPPPGTGDTREHEHLCPGEREVRSGAGVPGGRRG